MLSLFARLRPAAPISSAAYDAAVNEARQPHWYRAGAVPDTIDGRFAVLATVLALVDLRLEAVGGAGKAAAVSLTEVFIADMHAQMQQAGFGDPSLGKQVRHLVGSLASRIDRWRSATADPAAWRDVVRRSVHGEAPVEPAALDHCADACRSLWDRLSSTGAENVVAGNWR